MPSYVIRGTALKEGIRMVRPVDLRDAERSLSQLAFRIRMPVIRLIRIRRC